jgi:hypothetical protein
VESFHLIECISTSCRSEQGCGPALQRLKNITFNEEGEVIAEVWTFDWSAHEVANRVQLHVIHLVTLDAAAHLIYFALTKGGATKLLPTTIPTWVRSLWASGSGLSHTNTRSIKPYSKSTLKGDHGTDSSLFELDSVTGDLKMVMSNLETTTVASHDAVSRA